MIEKNDFALELSYKYLIQLNIVLDLSPKKYRTTLVKIFKKTRPNSKIKIPANNKYIIEMKNRKISKRILHILLLGIELICFIKNSGILYNSVIEIKLTTDKIDCHSERESTLPLGLFKISLSFTEE